MPVNEETEVAVDFSGGLVTNVSAIDASKTTFRTFKNVNPNTRGILKDLNGFGTVQLNINGTLTDLPAIPSGLTLKSKPFFFKITSPANSDVCIIYGTKGGRDRFYVWPDTSGGTITTNGGTRVANNSISWLELTEAEAVTVGSVTDVDQYALTGLENSSTVDYYNKWYLWNNNRSKFDYVVDFDGAGTVTTKFGITGTATNDVVIVFRFPVFQKGATVTPHYQIDSDDGLPSYAVHGQDIVIHTGTHHIDDGPDLWLGYLDRQTANDNGFFQDSELDYTGWHFDHAIPLTVPSALNMGSLVSANETTDPIPTTLGSYVILFQAYVLDGIERTNIYFDADTAFGSPIAVALTDDTSKADALIEIDPMNCYLRRSEFTVGSTYNTILPRRVSKISVFMALGDTTTMKASTAFFLIKNYDIDDSNWALASGKYGITFSIKGADWNAGQEFPFSRVNGYDKVQTGANARFEAQIANRIVIAPVYDETLKSYRGLFAPLSNVNNQVLPDVFPIANRIDVLFSGVPQIKNIIAQYGRCLFFGRDSMAIADVTGEAGGAIIEQVQKIGLVSPRALINIDGNVYFSSDESILEVYDGNQVADPSPGYMIKDLWDSYTTNEKESAFFGYQRREKLLFIAVGSTQRIFIFSVRDKNWREYASTVTFLDFVTPRDSDNLYAVTSSAIVEINSDSPTESLSIAVESQSFGNLTGHFKSVIVDYKSNTVLKLKPIDDTESATALRNKQPVVLVTQTGQKPVTREFPIKSERIRWNLSSGSGISKSIQVESLFFIKRKKRLK